MNTDIQFVTQELNELKKIQWPDGDNEGDALNHPSVFKALSGEDRVLVMNADQAAQDYLTQSVNLQRAITELNKANFPTSPAGNPGDEYVQYIHITIPHEEMSLWLDIAVGT